MNKQTKTTLKKNHLAVNQLAKLLVLFNKNVIGINFSVSTSYEPTSTVQVVNSYVFNITTNIELPFLSLNLI